MKVHLKQIPAEGIHLEGKEKTDILELEENQIRPLRTCRILTRYRSVRVRNVRDWNAWSGC